MTQNQIAYWNMVYDNRHKERADAETARSNYAKEVETNRTNVRNEAIKAGDVFGNLELNQNKLYETQRHNVAEEQIKSSGTLLDWTEAGLNPLWYTNAPTAIAMGATGLLTLPPQQAVADQNVDRLLSDARTLRTEAEARATAAKPVLQQIWTTAKEKAGNALNKLSSSAQNVVSLIYEGTPEGIAQRQYNQRLKAQNQKF